MRFLSQSLRYLTLRDRNYTRDAVYDAVYLLRALIAIVAGVVFGAWGLQGLPYFIGYLALSFVVVTSWLNGAGINVEEYESEKSPLHMEGLPQGVSLFVLVWITAFTLVGHGTAS